MYPCPHCSESVYSSWQKANATSIFPAWCPSCGDLAFVSGWAHALGSVVVEVTFWGVIILALVLRSWFVLALFPAGIALWSVILSSLFPLKPIERSAVASARRSAFIQLAIAALLITAASMLFGK